MLSDSKSCGNAREAEVGVAGDDSSGEATRGPRLSFEDCVVSCVLTGARGGAAAAGDEGNTPGDLAAAPAAVGVDVGETSFLASSGLWQNVSQKSLWGTESD